jgi:hypothetical protein
VSTSSDNEDGVPDEFHAWPSGGLCAWSRPCSLDALTARVAAGCGCGSVKDTEWIEICCASST